MFSEKKDIKTNKNSIVTVKVHVRMQKSGTNIGKRICVVISGPCLMGGQKPKYKYLVWKGLIYTNKRTIYKNNLR